MFDLKVTINGKPFNETNFKNELENSILEAAIETVTDQIRSALTPEEMQKITLNFQGDLDNFSVNISGDDDVVEKAVEALGDD